MEQASLFDDNAGYTSFVTKFKPKLTTDDCYTPALVYDAVAEWVAQEYGLDRAKFVRPFWPGADFMTMEYPPDCVVVDNPPFSILSKILEWYCRKNIRFFLFAPTLTCFTAPKLDLTYLPLDISVTYDNGAVVNTSFATNLDAVYRVRTAPALYDAVQRADAENQKALKAPPLPKYIYPDHVITAAIVGKWSRRGVEYAVKKSDCVYIPALDAQRQNRKSIFGGGFLLSERAAAERAAAERAAAHVWELSERERGIVEALGR